MKIWLFGTYAWQGNPKALFLYMTRHCAETHECWWIADNEDAAKAVKQAAGIERVTFMQSKKSQELFARADVYATENFRESYPAALGEQTKIFNMWHGVGLKHTELGLGIHSTLADSIVGKYIKNFSRYRNQTLFLCTSQAMETHFLRDTAVSPAHIVRGRYPRNEVYREIKTYQINDVLPAPLSEYAGTVLFAPTYRIGAVNGVLQMLLPDFEQLEQACRSSNRLFIVKVHPFMKKDDYFGQMQQKYAGSRHILFWDDRYDIYESFDRIDAAIIDYSSIFYDMLDAGVEKFIRYIPDLAAYQADSELIGDYMDLTDGLVAEQFQDLIDTLRGPDLPAVAAGRKQYLDEHFFGYKPVSGSLKEMIAAVDEYVLQPEPIKELHSFDIFDTLIRRSTLKPSSIFDYVRDRAKQSAIRFPAALLEDWVTIRNKVEHDVRDMMRRTTFERQSDTLEVTLDQIYSRLQSNMNLTDRQIEWLKQTEIEAEIAHVEPIQKRIDFLFSLKDAGHDVVLISDMYLPEQVIRSMLAKADPRLTDLPLYLSSNIGYQKSTGRLYQYIFFDLDYAYSRWVHYGDNKHADGSVPRKYGIQTMVHDIDDFIAFENELVGAMDNCNRYPAYQLATKMHRLRTRLVKQMDNTVLEQKYYAYAYAGSALIPYINWAVKDAVRRGYQTLYFISRDGHFLKQIADKIIEIKGYRIKTKYIYGSRKAWRLPSFIDKVDDETFEPFGNFTVLDDFQDLVKASYLSEDELLALFPEFGSLKTAKHLRGEIAENIRRTLKGSAAYCEKVLALAAEKRGIVREYLQQEINPKEKFAFVEFWGRGYTQDTFGRLLNDAFGRKILNPFYYVRSFTDNIATSIRHNFILSPQNFSFFEPVFAQTPYDSISGYEYKNGRVEPVIVPRDTEISDWLSEGLLKFTEDYLALNTNDADYFDYAVAKFTYQYQMTKYHDQFLGRVFGELKDNISSFGDAKSYAPALTVNQLENIASKQELDKLTLSVPMSLAKSDEKVAAYYQKIQPAYKLPAIKLIPMKPVYAVNPLSLYEVDAVVPFTVMSVQNNSFYFDVVFNDSTKRKDIYLKKSSTIEVIAVDFLKGGIPRLLTPQGYLTAHTDWVRKVENQAGNDAGYQRNAQRTVSNQSARSADLQTDNGLVRVDVAAESNKKRKQNKFARDPYRFFKDAKNPFAARLSVLFDENHPLGRALSRWVRRKFN